MSLFSLFQRSMIGVSLIALAATLSVQNWLTLWLAMEVNLFAFVPVLFSASGGRFEMTPAATKYFIAQVFASAMILATIGIFASIYPASNSLLPLGLFTALLLKLGIPPLHAWYPFAMNTLHLPGCFFLSTTQKLIPLMMLCVFFPPATSLPSTLVPFVIAFAAFYSGLYALNYSNIRPLLAYSSINHMSWILAANIDSLTTSLTYLGFYLLSSMMLFGYLTTLRLRDPYAVASLYSISGFKKISFMLLLLSYGGVPHSIGFLPKLITLQGLSENYPIMCLILLTSNMLILLCYLILGIKLTLGHLIHPTHPNPNWKRSLLMLLLVLVSNFLPCFLFIQTCALTLLYKP